MSIDGFRIPLLEQSIEINTPLPLKMNQKITTPPGTISSFKKHHINPNSLDTPIKNLEDVDGINLNKTLLLSPAFSSPQNQLRYGYNPDYLKHNVGSSPPTNFSSFDQEFEAEKPKKKKKKEKKAFDIMSSDKPPYSYATLIGMSILSHPDKRLTLSSIYQWISDTFRYYKKEDVGWQNSIRHNLSLNKAFIKGEKSKDGKGHFWCIEPGCEDQFLKLRNNKKGCYQEIMDQIYNNNQINLNQSSEVQEEQPTQIDNNERKRTIGSIPSSPNYYENQDNFSKQDSFNGNKKQKLSKQSDLGEPFDHGWELSPVQMKTLDTENQLDSATTPKVIVSESPCKPLVAGKNLTFTSSFSCNSNLELSPIRPNETGPLLEPLTPGRVYKVGAVNHHMQPIQYQSSNLFSTNINLNSTSLTPSIHNVSGSVQPHQSQTPNQLTSQQTKHQVSHSRSYSNSNNYLSQAKTPKANSKTPIRILKTPQTNLRKFWNSPGYLDDFYYSPLITSQSALHSYDDDDMILRAFESPANNRRAGGHHERKLSASINSGERLD